MRGSERGGRERRMRGIRQTDKQNTKNTQTPEAAITVVKMAEIQTGNEQDLTQPMNELPPTGPGLKRGSLFQSGLTLCAPSVMSWGEVPVGEEEHTAIGV